MPARNKMGTDTLLGVARDFGNGLAAAPQTAQVTPFPGQSFSAIAPTRARSRAEELHIFCTDVELLNNRGIPVCQAVRDCKPSRYSGVHLSDQRLRALWYDWKRSGKSLDRLSVHYPRKAVPAAAVKAFIHACATPGVMRWSQAARLVNLENFRVDRIVSAIPNASRRKIRHAFDARRAVELDSRKAVSRLQAKMQRRLLNDKRRSEGLRKIAEAIAP